MRKSPIFRKYDLYTRDSDRESWTYWGTTEPMTMEPEKLAERYAEFRGGQWKAEAHPGYQIQLQGIGWHPAILARELTPGAVVVWNYGHSSDVLEVRHHPSGKSVYAMLKGSNGQSRERRFAADRLIAVKPPARTS